MDALDRGRAAFATQAWSDAVAALAEADRASPLGPDDLERLATAAYLTGRDAASADAWTRAHHQLLARDEPRRAARCAIWLGLGLVLRGETVRGGGWLARARRVLAGGPPDLAEHGFLQWSDAFQAIMAGDPTAALAGFEPAAALGERHGDPDLAALGRVGAGRARIRLGDGGAGVALLDEVMVAVETGELSPIVVGDLYCTVLEGCQELFDLRRAQQWTELLAGWCAAQQDLVPYRGQCLLHRAELLALHGAWPDALEEARRAAGRFLEPTGHPAAGEAAYQQGELHRLRGEAAEAEAAYRQASRWGREPQPGLALLRLAQGQAAAAGAALRPGPGSCPPRWRSPWPAGTCPRPGRPPASSPGSPPTWTRRCWRRRPPPPRERSCSPRATPGPPWPPSGPPGRPGGSWRRRTRRPGPGGHRAGLPGPGRPGLGRPGAGRGPLGLPAARGRPRPGPGGGAGRRRPGRDGRRPDRPRGRGAAAGRHRPDQPGHRRRAGAERAHRGPPRQQHPHQARGALAGRRHRLGLRARAGLSRRWVEPPTGRPGQIWVVPAMPGARSRTYGRRCQASAQLR